MPVLEQKLDCLVDRSLFLIHHSLYSQKFRVGRYGQQVFKKNRVDNIRIGPVWKAGSLRIIYDGLKLLVEKGIHRYPLVFAFPYWPFHISSRRMYLFNFTYHNFIKN